MATDLIAHAIANNLRGDHRHQNPYSRVWPSFAAMPAKTAAVSAGSTNPTNT
jgi:hypothetical protein